MEETGTKIAVNLEETKGKGTERHSRWPLIGLVIYLCILAAIAFWPHPVDRDAGELLQWISDNFPFATYERIEFTANILLFVPYGFFLFLVLPRKYRALALVIVFGTTVFIESMQAALLMERTADISDIISNTIGGFLGTGVAFLVRKRW